MCTCHGAAGCHHLLRKPTASQGRKIVYNNKLYFVANEGTHGAELWVYDGTNTPTMVADIKQGSDGSYPVRPPTPIDRIPSRARACGCAWVWPNDAHVAVCVRAMVPMPAAITFSANRPHLRLI